MPALNALPKRQGFSLRAPTAHVGRQRRRQATKNPAGLRGQGCHQR